MLYKRNRFKYKDSHRWKIKGWTKVYQSNTKQKYAGVAI